MKSMFSWLPWTNERAAALRTALLTALCALSGPARSAEPVLRLEDLVATASKESEEVRSVELSLQATIAEIEARDYELAPRLTTEIAQVEDQRATFSPGRRSLSRLVDINLVKPFASGTTLGVRTGYEIADVASVASTRHLANWEISVTQALWRNSFGRGTRLRREGDAAELRSRKLDLLLRRQQFLASLETAYWDLTLAHREREIRRENLQRSETLESWIRDRQRRSAAEATDVYQVQALIDARRLELLDVENRIEAAGNRLAQLVPGLKPGSWAPDVRSLEAHREASALLAEPAGPDGVKPARLDSLVSRHRVGQARALAKREDDTLKPQLDLAVTHGRNGIENNFGSAWSRAFGSNSTYTKVGVVFSVELDGGLKDQRRRALALQADARELDARRLARESEIGWEELQRSVSRLAIRLETARAVALSQDKKSTEERQRYRQGRSTAFQTISFENEAAQARLDVYRLFAELRRTEAQARLFTADDRVPTDDGESTP